MSMENLIQVVGLTWAGCFALALLASAVYGWWQDRKEEREALQ